MVEFIRVVVIAAVILALGYKLSLYKGILMILVLLVALVCVAYFNSSAPTAGTNYEIDAIGTCFIDSVSAYERIGILIEVSIILRHIVQSIEV